MKQALLESVNLTSISTVNMSCFYRACFIRQLLCFLVCNEHKLFKRPFLLLPLGQTGSTVAAWSWQRKFMPNQLMLSFKAFYEATLPSAGTTLDDISNPNCHGPPAQVFPLRSLIRPFLGTLWVLLSSQLSLLLIHTKISVSSHTSSTAWPHAGQSALSEKWTFSRQTSHNIWNQHCLHPCLRPSLLHPCLCRCVPWSRYL